MEGKGVASAPRNRSLIRFYEKSSTLVVCPIWEQAAAALDRLLAGRLVVLAGPSGCGKSSLARAGVMPALMARGLTQKAIDQAVREVNENGNAMITEGIKHFV